MKYDNKNRLMRMAFSFTDSAKTVMSGMSRVVFASASVFIGVAAITVTLSPQAQAVAALSNSQSHYQTYVIHTYGGADLIPAVQQQLNSSGGGSVSVYQDKLILRTNSTGYNAVQQLLAQIDQAPQSLRVSVKVGNEGSGSGVIQQGQVIISNNGRRISKDNTNIGVYGRYGSQNSRQQSSSHYSVTTLSGSPASIGTSTLLSLASSHLGTIYNRYGKPVGYVRINGQTLANTAKGIAVTPRVMPNNQVQLTIEQVEDTVTGSRQTPVKSQQLVTTINLARGQWVTIGEISQSQNSSATGSYGSQSNNSTTHYPIQIKVD